MTSVTRIVFLDRDGVINEFPGIGNYVTSWEEFRFVPKALDAIRWLTESGYELNVISNQGCVSRGRMTHEALQTLTAKMLKAIEAAGGAIGGVFYCIHETKDQCECKKPKTALFKQAARGRDVHWESTYFIGDSEEDMEAGKNIGCQTVLVLSGRVREAGVDSVHPKPDIVKKDLWEAVSWIIQRRS